MQSKTLLYIVLNTSIDFLYVILIHVKHIPF